MPMSAISIEFPTIKAGALTVNAPCDVDVEERQKGIEGAMENIDDMGGCGIPEGGC